VRIVALREADELQRVTVAKIGDATSAAGMVSVDGRLHSSAIPRGGASSFPAPSLEQDEIHLPLPGAISNVVLGGGGRYLVIHLAKERQLAVFDASLAKIAGYIPLADEQVEYAAGQTDLLVAFPDARLLQRYDLATRKREVSAPFPFLGVLKTMSMGAGSNGPLLMVHSANTAALSRLTYEFLNPETMRKHDVNFSGRPRQGSYRDALHLRASMDGTVFGAWATSHSPTGVEALVLNGDELKTYYEHNSTAYVVPNAEGTMVYTSTGVRGVTQLTLTGSGRNRNGTQAFRFPSTSPEYDFSIPAQSPRSPRGNAGNSQQNITIHFAGEEEPLVTVPNVPIPTGTIAWNRSPLTLDRQLWLIPQAEMLVISGAGVDELYLRRIDIESLLESSGIDYLFVTSKPPSQTRPGQRFRYQIDARSKQGGLKYQLEAGPEGMKVSRRGEVSWLVPPEQSGVVTVIILVSDRTGQQKFHKFELGIR